MSKNKNKFRVFRILVFCLLGVYLVFMLVDMQINYAEKKEELLILQQAEEVQRIKNKDLRRQMHSGVEEVERIAREQGYVADNEKVFIDISGS